MTNEQKKQVRDALIRYAGSFDTQTAAAESLEGISASTISQVKNKNWELLSNRLWHHIARQVGFYCGDWQAADTTANLLLRILLADAQHYAMTYGMAIGEGLGKTFAARQYAHGQPEAYYLGCNEEYNRKSFVAGLLNAAGMEAKGTTPELMKQLTDFMAEKEEAVLILDDAHKLKDRVLHLAVMLANSLAGKAGIVIMGSEKLRTRLLEGVRLNKEGYGEIYKSIGRRFITLCSLGPNDAEMVCRANGVYDDCLIAQIKEESKNLHNVTQMIMETQIKIAA